MPCRRGSSLRTVSLFSLIIIQDRKHEGEVLIRSSVRDGILTFRTSSYTRDNFGDVLEKRKIDLEGLNRTSVFWDVVTVTWADCTYIKYASLCNKKLNFLTSSTSAFVTKLRPITKLRYKRLYARVFLSLLNIIHIILEREKKQSLKIKKNILRKKLDKNESSSSQIIIILYWNLWEITR